MAIARDLFNARGFGNVTVAQIAAAANISEGNLWYHFRDKKSLVDALSAQLIADLDKRLLLRPKPGDHPIGAYADFLACLCIEMNTHLFLYRDQAEYGAHSDAFAARLGDIYTRTIEQIASYIEALSADGFISLAKEHHEPTAKTMTIVLRYYPEYVLENPAETGTDPVALAIKEHLVPLAPFMTADIRSEILREAFKRIDEAQMQMAL